MEHSQSAIAQTYDVDDADNAVLYNALKKEMTSEVVRLCQQRDIYRDGPLHILTIHGDTVLHMAAYTMQVDLVIQLLEMLPEYECDKLMTSQNSVKSTILHEAATFNKLVPAAKKMLQMAPGLLSMRNDFEETALFRAAKFGKIKMFSFLDREVRGSSQSEDERRTKFYQKPNNSTILHTAVISAHFKLALRIAKRYEYLVGERDEVGMTALQHLARNSPAFQDRNAGHLRRLIYKCVSEEFTPQVHATGWRVPLWEEIQNEKQRYELAKELARFLVKKDTTSWKKTKPVEQYSRYLPKKRVEEGETQNDGRAEMKIKEQKPPENDEPPLFLATKAGCVDIVEYILDLYPQAVEYVDVNGHTILHIAIKYRRIEIFNMVEKIQTSVRKLIQKIDKDGNSILHMVAEKTEYTLEQTKLTEFLNMNSDSSQGNVADNKEDYTLKEKRDKNSDSNQGKVIDNKEDDTLKEKNDNLVLQLQEDLLLFERVKKICSEHFFNHVNYKGQTAEQAFALKSEKLHTEAKEWLKRTAENSSLVAVLIATVAFAAAYTVPGGSNDQTGVPILLNKPLFVVFTITDVLSLTCTLTSIVIFLSILTSAFRLKDFKNSLPQKLVLGLTFLIMSVSMMMWSFAATIALMIHNKEQWTKLALYTVAFLPVIVFAFSYTPLYLSSLKTFKYIIKEIEHAFPRYSGFKTKILNFISKSKTKVPHPHSGV